MIIYRQPEDLKETLVTFTADNLTKSQDGRKTQTRRLMRPQPSELADYPIEWAGWTLNIATYDGDYVAVDPPYGRPGDMLLFAEPYKVQTYSPITGYIVGQYRRDEEPFCLTSLRVAAMLHQRKQPMSVTPARFMYKELARHKAILLDVRAQRVQEISDEDALAEGIEYRSDPQGFYYGDVLASTNSPITAFHALWDSINERRGHGWDKNEWVFAYTYGRVHEEKMCDQCNGRWYISPTATVHVGDKTGCIPF